MEKWKPIPSFPGYLASTEGRIKGPKGILRPHLGKHGYYTFKPGRKNRTTYVHRAVAETWLIKTGPVVNHKNHIKTDNTVNNLEWCTYKHNTACSNLLHGHNKTKLTQDDKIKICVDYASGNFSQRQLAKTFGVTQKTIFNVLRSEKR